MATTYERNEFGEVVPTYDGRQSNSTTDRRPITEYEEQLLTEVAELEAKILELEAKVTELEDARPHLLGGN